MSDAALLYGFVARPQSASLNDVSTVHLDKGAHSPPFQRGRAVAQQQEVWEHEPSFLSDLRRPSSPRTGQLFRWNTRGSPLIALFA